MISTAPKSHENHGTQSKRTLYTGCIDSIRLLKSCCTNTRLKQASNFNHAFYVCFCNKLCGMPPQYAPAPATLTWPFDLESGVRGPMYATDRHQTDTRRQTSYSIIAECLRLGGIIMIDVSFINTEHFDNRHLIIVDKSELALCWHIVLLYIVHVCPEYSRIFNRICVGILLYCYCYASAPIGRRH